MSKLINMVFGEGGLELSYNRGVGFGLAERKEWASPKKGVSLNRCNKVGGAVRMVVEDEVTGLIKTKGSCKEIIRDKAKEVR